MNEISLVIEEDSNERMDKYLSSLIPEYSRSFIKNLIDGAAIDTG